MKVMVVYSSKSGITKRCAEYIASKIVGSDLVNLNEEVPDISAYDAVLVGSGVRMAKIYKPVKKFLAKNAQLLSTKKTMLFLSNFYPETLEKTIQKNVPENLTDHFSIVQCGGVAPFSKVTDQAWLKKTEIDASLVKMGVL